MAGISLSGLASGLDWQTLVNNLITAEQTPETAMRATQTANTQKSSALSSLSTQLTALSTSISALSSADGNVFSSRAASLADSTSGWKVSAGAGAAIGNWQVDVTKLATKAALVGTSDAGAPLSTSSDVSGLTIGTLPIASTITPGVFTVNGTQITVAATDSLADVFQQIQTKTGVTASYDPTSDQVQLSGSGEIVLGSANDTSNFLGALGLYNNGTGNVLSPKALGVVSVTSAIAHSNLKTAITNVDASGNGTFSINGVSINYNVNDDSVQNVIDRINASSAGVTAALDPVNDRFTLTNNTTGDVGISTSEGAGGLLAALGLGSAATLSHGTNAQYNVNGGPTLTSASNTIDGTSAGMAGLSITANSLGTENVNVAVDNSGAKTAIQNFITQYNAVQSYISQQTKTTVSNGTVSTSTLSGNREVSSIASTLRSDVFDAVPGLSGTIQRLNDLGIDFTSGTSQLAITNSAKLDSALANNPGDVQRLFADPTNGLATRLKTFVQNVTGTTGAIATETANLASNSKSIDDQIAAMEVIIQADRARLTAGFVAMESAQSALQSQQQALNRAFGTTSTSSSSSSSS